MIFYFFMIVMLVVIVIFGLLFGDIKINDSEQPDEALVDNFIDELRDDIYIDSKFNMRTKTKLHYFKVLQNCNKLESLKVNKFNRFSIDLHFFDSITLDLFENEWQILSIGESGDFIIRRFNKLGIDVNEENIKQSIDTELDKIKHIILNPECIINPNNYKKLF